MSMYIYEINEKKTGNNKYLKYAALEKGSSSVHEELQYRLAGEMMNCLFVRYHGHIMSVDLCGVAWSGVVWFGVAGWCGGVRCGGVRFGGVRFGGVWCGFSLNRLTYAGGGRLIRLD